MITNASVKEKLLPPLFGLISGVWLSLAAFGAPSSLLGVEIDVEAATIKNSCGPFLYGACIEDVNHEIYGGLYGQLLYGESFEEPGTSKPFVGVPPVEVSGMWDPVQTGSARASFSLDPAQPFNGVRSQRVEHTGGTGSVGVANRGLNRWGIAVQKGRVYAGRVHLRSSRRQGAVTVSLQSADGARTYASQTFAEVPDAWTNFPFTLTAADDDPAARFVITLDAPGVLWIDQAVLLKPPTGQFQGLPVREDIADTMVAGGLRFLRYGGTAVNAPGYRWKKMIGDPDRRPPYQGHWHPDTSNGFGIVEFVEFCRRAKIEPAFAINVEETPQDTADMVEYLNGAATTRWGKVRAADGHPEPYGVRYIEIGNEEVIWGDVAVDYDHYIERFRLLAAAMRRVDPRLVFINAAWWRGDNPNSERVFKALEGDAAYWDFHTDADEADAGAKVGQTLDEAQRLFQRWVPGAKMKVVIFEENGNHHDLQRALGHATTLNAVRRHGDLVAVDCEANGLQPWRQNDNGWDQGHVFFTPSQVWGMPPYYAQQMASENHQPLVVSSQVTGGNDLDVTATKSADGQTLCLHVVNLASTATARRLKIGGLPTIDRVAQTSLRDRLDGFDFAKVALGLYDFVYGELCDWYLEMVKPRLYAEDEPNNGSSDRAEPA